MCIFYFILSCIVAVASMFSNSKLGISYVDRTSEFGSTYVLGGNVVV